MQALDIELETKQVPTRSTHTVDAFMRREVKDDETGKTEVKVVRWQEDRQVSANLTVDKKGGRVFHNGARIA